MYWQGETYTFCSPFRPKVLASGGNPKLPHLTHQPTIEPPSYSSLNNIVAMDLVHTISYPIYIGHISSLGMLCFTFVVVATTCVFIQIIGA